MKGSTRGAAWLARELHRDDVGPLPPESIYQPVPPPSYPLAERLSCKSMENVRKIQEWLNSRAVVTNAYL